MASTDDFAKMNKHLDKAKAAPDHKAKERETKIGQIYRNEGLDSIDEEAGKERGVFREHTDVPDIPTPDSE
jgi:hypothetical protein